MDLTLTTPIDKLRMVGPTHALRLKKLNIETIEDLLLHAPHRYLDFSRVSSIGMIQPGELVTVVGSVTQSQNVYTKTRKVIQKLTLCDDTGEIEATWFNQPFIPKTLRAGESISLSGEVKATRARKEFISPEYELLKPSAISHQPSAIKTIHTGRLVPVYPETEGLSSKWLRSRIAPLLPILIPQVKDWLPDDIRKNQVLLTLPEAIAKLHFPQTQLEAEQAKARLAFDELLLLQLKSLLRKNAWQSQKLAHKIALDQGKIRDFVTALPFKLTNAQTRVTNQLLADLKKERPMNRLLQGDVGCGKTVVAATGMYASFLNNLPSALMAPTEILAFQHEKTIRDLLSPYGIQISICTASRKENLEKFDVVVGTHALLYERLKPLDFGLVVIDEQHRFGVEQRARLIKKGSSPHILTMTATPIPRTVALTLYGDLDLSVIDEMPPGRTRVKTWVVPPKKRANAYNWILERILTGEQAFIVCPLIEESKHESMLQVKAASDEFARLAKHIFPGLKLALLHGRLKSREKEEVIQKFRAGKTQILVTTPVVEVGIDIPNATIMMIEGAERFGLAQLHQLRGRVGRGTKQSFCLLFTSTPQTNAIKRLKALETAMSGLSLAELDLKLRGPGEIYGTRQHGFVELKFASIQNSSLVAKTRLLAADLVREDPELKKYPEIKTKLVALEKPIEPN